MESLWQYDDDVCLVRDGACDAMPMRDDRKLPGNDNVQEEPEEVLTSVH